MTNPIDRGEADRFLLLLDQSRTKWRFRAQNEKGDAVEIVSSLDDAILKLAELNRQGYEIFVGSAKPHPACDSVPGPIPAEHDALCFLAALGDMGPDDSEDWEAVAAPPHVVVQVGASFAQYVWRVTGLSDGKAACLRQDVASICGIGDDNLLAGFAYLPGFTTNMGEEYGNPFAARIVKTREGEPIHGASAWIDDHVHFHECYLAEHQRKRAPKVATSDATSASEYDDATVLAALRAAVEAGERVPARLGSNASAWHALRTLPELGRDLSHRRGRERVHAALMRLQRAGRIKRVSGRTAGRRDAEFFEIVS